MPTPHGSRGGMAFSADELRVLRRALANAIHSSPVPEIPEVPDHEVRECLRLAQAVDDATRESHRLRAFLAADLARYRAALPGSALSYQERLQEALDAGYAPTAEDVTAVRGLCAEQTSTAETARRAGLLRQVAPPPARARLQALPGGLAADKDKDKAPDKGKEPDKDKGKEPDKEKDKDKEPDKEKDKDKGKGAPKPEREQPPAKPASPPGRPVPTPAEVFPPRRRPAPPPPEERVAVMDLPAAAG